MASVRTLLCAFDASPPRVDTRSGTGYQMEGVIMKKRIVILAFALLAMLAFVGPAAAGVSVCPKGYSPVLVAIVIQPDGDAIPVYQCQPDSPAPPVY